MSTERVEINPDNNNKTLEQSQEDLAKQGVNVNEGVVNKEGKKRLNAGRLSQLCLRINELNDCGVGVSWLM